MPNFIHASTFILSCPRFSRPFTLFDTLRLIFSLVSLHVLYTIRVDQCFWILCARSFDLFKNIKNQPAFDQSKFHSNFLGKRNWEVTKGCILIFHSLVLFSHTLPACGIRSYLQIKSLYSKKVEITPTRL
jgi:hypothetical protein